MAVSFPSSADGLNHSARRRNSIFATHVFGLAESMLMSLQHRNSGMSKEFARLATSITEMRKVRSFEIEV